MQEQLVCSGCRRVVQYRRGVAGVCCPGCNTHTSVATATEMSELICNGCKTLLLFNRGASNIRCSSCNRLNSTRPGSQQYVHLTCGQCRTTLMYKPGACTVQCATCRYDNPVRDARPHTVLVENPKTLDDKGKLVTNVVVGVTSWKR